MNPYRYNWVADTIIVIAVWIVAANVWGAGIGFIVAAFLDAMRDIVFHLRRIPVEPSR